MAQHSRSRSPARKEPQPETPFDLTLNTMSGGELKIQVHGNYTVARVKTMIHEMNGVPSAVQRLIFKGVELEDDNMTMDQCQIFQAHETLTLVRSQTFKIKVLVRCAGVDDHELKLEVKSQDTVDNIKAMIEEQVGPIEDEPCSCALWGQQENSNLFVLVDGSSTLSDNNIGKSSSLVVFLN